MGWLDGFVGGAGAAMADTANQQMQEAEKARLAQINADLDQKKVIAIYQAQNDIQNAPLNRFAALAQQEATKDEPVAPAPVTETTGILDPSAMGGVDGLPIQTQGGNDVGLSGNIAALRRQIMLTPVSQMSAEDRAGALAQLDAQADQQRQANADAVAGQTRKRTPDEAEQAAFEKAKFSDPQAYLAAQPLMTPKTGELADGAILYNKQNGQIIMQNDNKAKLAQLHEDSRDARAQAAQDAQNERLTRALLDKDHDTQFIKELKTLYPDGGPDYDEALRQRINKETGVNAAAGGGGRSVVYNGRIIASGNEIAAALHNITDLPVGTNAGFLGSGQPNGHGILDATAAALKNELNSDQVKTYNTMWTGISRNLGTLETSGLATTGSLIASIDKLSIVPGDNGYNVQRKLAEVRQIVDAALEPKLADPTVPPTQKQFIQSVMDKVADAVPYTHQDLTAYRKAVDRNPTLTLADYAKNTVQATQPSAAPAVTTGWSNLRVH